MTATTEAQPIITEEILDKAIAAAKEGHVNGLTYDQSNWCGTACCVAGFARHIAEIPERDQPLDDDEVVDTPRMRRARSLMGSPWPGILNVLERIDSDGKIYLAGADLAGADLRRADLADANLAGADLRRADLADANLRRADLRRADLADANLRRADLTGANLTGADLRRADLTDANLTGADFMGADGLHTTRGLPKSVNR